MQPLYTYIGVYGNIVCILTCGSTSACGKRLVYRCEWYASVKCYVQYVCVSCAWAKISLTPRIARQCLRHNLRHTACDNSSAIVPYICSSQEPRHKNRSSRDIYTNIPLHVRLLPTHHKGIRSKPVVSNAYASTQARARARDTPRRLRCRNQPLPW